MGRQVGMLDRNPMLFIHGVPVPDIMFWTTHFPVWSENVRECIGHDMS
jgi:hypothetical protein